MIRLTLELPPKVLSPNARPHWAAKSKATKGYRWAAWCLAKQAVGRKPPLWERAETRVVFYWPDRRRRDRDNASASLKAAWDGLADAGVIANDAGFTHHPPEMCCDKSRPRVEIEVRELAA